LPKEPWGPPWIRKATGYFLPGSKSTGFTSQACTVSPSAPAKLKGSGVPKRVAATRASFMWVRRRSSLPSAAAVVQLASSEQ